MLPCFIDGSASLLLRHLSWQVNMKGFLLAFTVVATAHAVSVYDVAMDEWKLYKTSAKKFFRSSEEEFLSLKHFMEAKDLVAKHNERYLKGLEHYELALNRLADKPLFGDLDEGKAKTRFMQESEQLAQMRSFRNIITVPPNVELPPSVDWKTKGAVSAVVDQQSCGSCYAITTAAAMEAQMFMSTSSLRPLSAQQILDCSKSFGNDGCDGGTYFNTFNYLETIGLAFSDDYPYENSAGNCRVSGKNVSLPVKEYYYASHDEAALKYALATYGPVTIAVNARPRTFQLYKSGVYSDPACGPTLVHAVLLIGYGTDEKTKQDYWIIKNSWGKWWGEDGFMRLARNVNMCGVATYGYVPKVV